MASDRILRWLCWALVVFAIASAALALGLQLDLFAPFPEIPDTVDFVDRLVAFRGYDASVAGYVVILSLTSLGLYLIAAVLGVELRRFTSRASLRSVPIWAILLARGTPRAMEEAA